MFSKDKELERHMDFEAEEIGELSDEQLDAVVGGTDPYDLIKPPVTCQLCGTEQPFDWTSDTCYACGSILP